MLGAGPIENDVGASQGLGKVIKDPCRVCAGSGRQRKEKTLNVTVPAGVEEGTRIRLSGEGEVGMLVPLTDQLPQVPRAKTILRDDLVPDRFHAGHLVF